jgi:hypothetical protein
MTPPETPQSLLLKLEKQPKATLIGFAGGRNKLKALLNKENAWVESKGVAVCDDTHRKEKFSIGDGKEIFGLSIIWAFEPQLQSPESMFVASGSNRIKVAPKKKTSGKKLYPSPDHPEIRHLKKQERATRHDWRLLPGHFGANQ